MRIQEKLWHALATPVRAVDLATITEMPKGSIDPMLSRMLAQKLVTKDVREHRQVYWQRVEFNLPEDDEDIWLYPLPAAVNKRARVVTFWSHGE